MTVTLQPSLRFARLRLLAGLIALLCLAAPALSAAAKAPEDADRRPASNDFDRKPDSPGGKIFSKRCSVCHDHGVAHAPPQSILVLLPASTIHNALTKGAMREQGKKLTDAQKVTVAEYLSGKKLGDEAAQSAPPMCTEAGARFDYNEPPVFPGWGLTPGNTRQISREVAGLDPAALPRLRLKWSFAFPGALRARSQPALAGGAIYIGSHSGTVYALDRNSGCVRWTFEAGAEVRTGIVVSPWQAGDSSAAPLAYFGDLIGNVFAVDARTGALVWRDHTDENPNTTITAAPALHDGHLYVSVSSLEEANVSPTYQCCKFRGSVLAYDARTGARQWHTFLIKPAHRVGKNVAGAKKFGPAGASIWNTPAIDEKRAQLTVGTGNDYSSPPTDASDAVVALDLATGKVKWVHQAVSKDGWNASCSVPDKALCPEEDGPDYDFGAATMITKASDGRDIVLGGEKSGDVLALDPDDGHQLWKTKVGRGGILAGIYFGMAASGDSVFVPISDMDDGRKYQQPAQPGLYALNLLTGEFLWKAPASPTACEGRKSCSPGIAAAITATPDLVLTGASDGWLRIYDSASGKVLWQFDTVQNFNTVGGGTGTGGSIGGGAAPIAYHGTLIAPSGYGFANQRQGNVLLVFDIAD